MREMNEFKIINRLMICLIVGIIACSDPTLESALRTDVNGKPLNDTESSYLDYPGYTPDPSREGIYDVCEPIVYDLPERSYSIGGAYGNKWRNGRIYFPKDVLSNNEECEIIDYRFPLVVLLNADNAMGKSDLDTYENMAEHIASHGFIVQLINRNSVTGEFEDEGQKLFYLHTQYAFDSIKSKGKNLGSFMNHDLAIIGHSAGGSTITKLLGNMYDPGKPGIYGAGFNLKAIVFMSPTVYNEFVDVELDLSAHVPSMMGFSASHDGDAGAFGHKGMQKTMQTAVKYYDDFTHGNKEFIFLNGSPLEGFQGPPNFNHWYQDHPATRAYITAYLRRELKGDFGQNKFLKFQQKPGAINQQLDIRQLSWSDDYQTLVDFENGSIQNGVVNDVTLHYDNISSELYTSAIDDEFSPHNTKCVKLAWDHQQNNDPSFTITNEANSINGQNKYLTFTTSQVYEGNNNLSDLDFSITLIDNNADPSNSINISSFGGLLKSPIILQMFHVPLYGETDGTKNAMRSYVVPFSAFNGIDLTQIEIIKFEFNDPNYPTGHIILDNISITD